MQFLRTYPSLKLHLLFNSDGLAIWHYFPVIKHIKVKSGNRSAILKLIKLIFFTVYPYLQPHIFFNSNGLDRNLGRFSSYYVYSIEKHSKVNKFYQSEISRAYPPPLLFYCNGLAIWYGFPDITHFKVDNCRMSAILNFIELKFLRTYPPLKPHLLLICNGLAIWHDFPVIKHIEVKSGRR